MIIDNCDFNIGVTLRHKHIVFTGCHMLLKWIRWQIKLQFKVSLLFHFLTKPLFVVLVFWFEPLSLTHGVFSLVYKCPVVKVICIVSVEVIPVLLYVQWQHIWVLHHLEIIK